MRCLLFTRWRLMAQKASATRILECQHKVMANSYPRKQ